MNANKAAEAARKQAQQEFVANTTAALELESKQIKVAQQKLEFEFRRQQLANGSSPQSSDDQQTLELERLKNLQVYGKSQQSSDDQQGKNQTNAASFAHVIIPANSNSAEKQQATKTTEIESSQAATPAQATAAENVVLGKPLDTVLGDAKTVDGKITRSVNVTELSKAIKNQNIDADLDRAMGNKFSAEDINKATEKFIESLKQNRSISNSPEGSSEVRNLRLVQVAQKAMLAAGAYKLTTKLKDDADRVYNLQRPLEAGVMGRTLSANARIFLGGIDKDVNKHEALMNKAAGLSALEKQPDFQDENGKFDAEKVAAAFTKGDFNSFLTSGDKRIEGLYAAAQMVAKEYQATQTKEAATIEPVIEAEFVNENQQLQPENTAVNDPDVIDAEFVEKAPLGIEGAPERLALAAAKEDIIPIAQDNRGGEELAQEAQAMINAYQAKQATNA